MACGHDSSAMDSIYACALCFDAAPPAALVEQMAEALEQWRHWFADDSTQFNRDMAHDAGLKALAAYRAWKDSQPK